MNTPPGGQYGSYVGKIARGAGISTSGQGLGRLLAYATQVALARMYGPSQLGFYVLGFTLVQVAKILAQFGMDNGLVRYVAHHQARGDISRVRGTILLGLCIAFGLSVAISGLIFVGASSLAGIFVEEVSDQASLAVLFKAFSVSVPFFTVMSVALWATQGFQTVKYATYVEQIAQPLINLMLVVAFFLLGMQILGAAIAYALSMASGLVLALYYLKRVFPELLNKDISLIFESRALLSSSGPMVVASFAPYLNTWTVVVVLSVFTTTEAVGIYNVAARTAAFSTLVLFAFSGIFSPMISSLYGRGLLGDLSDLYKDVSRWIFTGALAISMLTMLLARDIMAVFGNEFIYGWAALTLVAGAELFNCSTGPASRMLAMTGHHKIVVLATLSGAVVALIMSVALIPLYGILGAATATAGGIVLTNTITLAVVRREINSWPYSRQYFKPLIAGLLTAAAAYLAKSVLQLPEGLPAIIILGPCILTVFGVIILRLRLSPSDQQLLKALWAAVRTAGRDA